MSLKLKESNYITIPALARNEFDLSGNELLIFGIIYGFSQAKKTSYTGTTDYLKIWTGLGERTILRILKKLTDSGVLKKRKVGSNECHYSVNFSNTDCQNDIQPTAKMADTDCQNGIQPTAKMADNIIYTYSKDNIKENNKRKKFKKPTIEEIKKYCQEINSNIDPQRFFDYYQANGWTAGRVPMKNWHAAVRNWTRNDRSFNQQNSKINKHDFQQPISQEELNQYDRK